MIVYEEMYTKEYSLNGIKGTDMGSKQVANSHQNHLNGFSNQLGMGFGLGFGGVGYWGLGIRGRVLRVGYRWLAMGGWY